MISASISELPFQLYHLIGEKTQYYRALPSTYLQRYIYYYWWLNIAPGDTTIEVIPDNAADLVMSPDIDKFSVLYFPAAEKFTIPLSGPITYVGISFRTEQTSSFFNLREEQLPLMKRPDKHNSISCLISRQKHGIRYTL